MSRVRQGLKYPIGTCVRKKFVDSWFDGEVVSINSKFWKIRYTDGDEEDMNVNEVRIHHDIYTQTYNTK